MTTEDPYYDGYDEYEEEEDYCDFGGEAGICMITSARFELEDLEKNPLHFIRKRFNKKYKEKREGLYQTLALSALEHCSFTCPLRPRGDD